MQSLKHFAAFRNSSTALSLRISFSVSPAHEFARIPMSSTSSERFPFVLCLTLCLVVIAGVWMWTSTTGKQDQGPLIAAPSSPPRDTQDSRSANASSERKDDRFLAPSETPSRQRLNETSLEESSSEVALDEAEAPSKLEVRTLSGAARFANGRVAAGVEVYVSARHPAASNGTVGVFGQDLFRQLGTTDSQGRFRFLVRDGSDLEWTVFGQIGNSSAVLRGVRAPDESLTLELPTVGRLGVQLIEFSNGMGTAPGRLSWRASGSEVWQPLPKVELDSNGISWFSLRLGEIDLSAEASNEDLLTAEVLNVAVREQGAPVEEIVLQEGVRLTLSFRPESGELAFPPSCFPTLIDDGDRTVPDVIWQAPGRIQYRGVEPGTYQLFEQPAFEFEPKSFSVGPALDCAVEVVWRIADATELQRLVEAEQEFQRAVESGLVGPGDD